MFSLNWMMLGTPGSQHIPTIWNALQIGPRLLTLTSYFPGSPHPFCLQSWRLFVIQRANLVKSFSVSSSSSTLTLDLPKRYCLLSKTKDDVKSPPPVTDERVCRCVCGWGGGLKKTESQGRKVSPAPASKVETQEKHQSPETASTWEDGEDIYSSSLTIKCDL